jgi:glycosyltransferase involved in cell wall biosynthesis
MLVSVLLPVYNAANFLDDSIQSIINQTYANFELIIVDDGSTDGSDLICKHYRSLDSRIRYFKQSNMGIVSALNFGISKACGELLCRMDADDISMPLRLEKQVIEFLSRPNLVLLGTQVLFTNFKSFKRVSNYPVSDSICKEAMIMGPCFAHPSVMIRMSTIRKHNILYTDEHLYAEDYSMWVTLSKYGGVSNLKEVLLNYRVHSMQTSQKNREIQIASHVSISCKYLSEFYNLDVDPGSMKSLIFNPTLCGFKGAQALFKILQCNSLSLRFRLRVVIRHIIKGLGYA